MDDTITWLLPVWVEWLNKHHNLNVDWQDIKQWDMSVAFPTLTKEQIYAPLKTEEIWDLISPRDGAVEALATLHNSGFEIFICTSTDYRNIKPKYEKVISKYFPFIDWRHIIVTSNKRMIWADFIIDDAPHNLIGGIQPHQILMSMPHNDIPEIKNYGIIRIGEWGNVVRLIRYISSRDKLANYIKHKYQSSEE